MNCHAPESELLVFRAAGTLSSPESAAVDRHVSTCADCREELAASLELTRGLNSLHLTPEEIVSAAWDPKPIEHLGDCVGCREEVELLRGMNQDLAPSRSFGPRTRSALALAAGVALAASAGLYVGTRLAGPVPTPIRGGEERAAGLAVDATVELHRGARASVPRANVLIVFPMPARSAGERIDLAIAGPSNERAFSARDVAVADGSGRVVVDARVLSRGVWRLILERIDASGVLRERVTYEMLCP